MDPSCEQGKRMPAVGGAGLTGAFVFSAGNVFQLPLPLCGVGLLPGPGTAASRGCRWHPAHVHS